MGHLLAIKYAELTDVGRARSANEDNMGHGEYPWGEVFVVCDGMGGHVGGARASEIAVNSILEFFARDLWVEPMQGLQRAISFANEQIYATALNEPTLKGMGTTCVCLIIQESGIWLGHVGDSRIYIHTDGQLHKLTRDHSFVQGLVDQGTIAEEDAEAHPRKNELMRALGIGPDVQVEITQQAIYPKQGDMFLLCSDGLNGMIGDKGIAEVLNGSGDLTAMAEGLIAAANAAGGMDNITAQLVLVQKSPHLSNRYEAIKPPINMARTMPVEQQAARPPLQPNPPVRTPDPRSPLQRYWPVIAVCAVVFVVGILALSGVFGGGGPSAAELARQDSLRLDSIAHVKADSARAAQMADSIRQVAVADSLRADSIEKAKAKPKPKPKGEEKPKTP